MKRIKTVALLIGVILFSCSPEYPLDLGNGYSLDYDSWSHLYILDTNNTVVINAHIVAYAFNSTYVLVEQKPRGEILKDFFHNTEVTLSEIEKIFRESPLRYYWILNKKEKNESIGSVGEDVNWHRTIYSNVYGPYSKEQFEQKRKELGISDLLKLSEE